MEERERSIHVTARPISSEALPQIHEHALLFCEIRALIGASRAPSADVIGSPRGIIVQCQPQALGHQLLVSVSMESQRVDLLVDASLQRVRNAVRERSPRPSQGQPEPVKRLAPVTHSEVCDSAPSMLLGTAACA